MRMRLRIMHVLDNMGRGGMQTGLVNLIHRMDPSRFEHVICTLRHLDHPAAHNFEGLNVRMMCLDDGHGGLISGIPRLARTIRELRPEIVHSRNWSAIESVVAARWVRGCAIIHSEHGLDSSTVDREPWRRACFRRVAYELADQVLCVSHQLRSIHADRTAFPNRKIAVIHNGVDPQIYKPDARQRNRIRAELGLRDEFVIGCVGNLTPVKNHMTLLEAMRQAHARCGNWRVVLVGVGPEDTRLKNFLAGHPSMADRVQFLGISTRVPELLSAFDVYVLPSLTEGICNSLLEAMATGLPVVATDTGGNPEVVVNGDSGLLFPIRGADTLASLLVNLFREPELRARLGRGAIRRVNTEFSMEAMVSNYQQLYESLGKVTPAPLRAVVGT